MTDLIAPHDTSEAAAFLRSAHDGPLTWFRSCLEVQRKARGLPPVYPSAAAAAAATPEEDRVYNLDEVKRGMVMFFDDIHDSNTAGHIVFACGRDAHSNILTWTNDAVREGGIDVVQSDFFPRHWGDPFLFAATSLNGYKFPDFHAAPATPPPASKPETSVGTGHLGANFTSAMDALQVAIDHHKRKGHDQLVRVLERDLKRMQHQAARFQ